MQTFITSVDRAYGTAENLWNRKNHVWKRIRNFKTDTED